VRSYFSFLRWLFLLNIYVFLLIFTFIVVPTIVFENLRNSDVSISSQLNTAHNGESIHYRGDRFCARRVFNAWLVAEPPQRSLLFALLVMRDILCVVLETEGQFLPVDNTCYSKYCLYLYVLFLFVL